MISALWHWHLAGGPLMLLISACGLVILTLLIERSIRLSLPTTWARHRRRELDHLFHGTPNHAVADQGASLALAEYPELSRHFALIRALIAIAPMLGLLGTVGGMIDTFDALLYGQGTSAMADGIAQALLTTQYGLSIAIPALIIERILNRRAEDIAWQLEEHNALLRRDGALE